MLLDAICWFNSFSKVSSLHGGIISVYRVVESKKLYAEVTYREVLSIKWPAIVLLEFHIISLSICGTNSPNDKRREKQAPTRIRKNLKLNIEIADILQIRTLELYTRLGWMVSLFSSRMPSSYKRKIICQTFSASLSWSLYYDYK